MLKVVVVQGLLWESHEAILQPSDMTGEERSPEGEVLVFLVLPSARYLRLSALVAFHTWPGIPALLTPV